MAIGGLSLFGNRGGSSGSSQEDLDRAADAAARRRERARRNQGNEDTSERVADIEDRVDGLLEKMEADDRKAQSGGSQGGGFLEIIQLFQTLNIDSAASYAITRSTEAAKGPVDSQDIPIGGATYDPGSSTASVATNGRILKWNVNQTVYLARSLMAFCLYFSIQLKWHVLELVLGATNGADLAGLGDLLIFGVLLGGLGGTSGSTTAGGLGFLGSLFNFGTNAAVMNPAPFYTTV